MTTIDSITGIPTANSINEDSTSNASKTGSIKKQHHAQHFQSQSTPNRANHIDERDKTSFYKDLYHFHEIKGYTKSIIIKRNALIAHNISC